MKRLISILIAAFILSIAIPGIATAGDLTLQIPYIGDLPYDAYENITPVVYQGGEEKFGKWRNFFNGFEMGFGFTYNSRWNYRDNTWEGRDSGDSRANICAMARFNVAEGNVGGNVFEINFAPGADQGVKPDWHGGASYFFYDGSSETYAPATFMIRGAGNMDAMVKLAPNEGEAPNRINLRSACDGRFYLERELFGSMVYYPFYSSVTDPLLVFDGSFAAVGHSDPESALDVAGAITIRCASGKMEMSMDPVTGNVHMKIVHNGITREADVVSFAALVESIQ